MAVGTGREGASATLPTHTWWNFTVLGADIALFQPWAQHLLGLYDDAALCASSDPNSNFLVALIPAIRALGLFGPQLLVAPLVERRRHAATLYPGRDDPGASALSDPGN